MPQWAGDITAFMGTPWGALAIFGLRIVDVSCDTMRILFAVRGKRLVAGALGFVQVLVWLFAVGSALQHLNSWLHVLGYAAGYATGTMVGITIEQAVAYGLAVVRITSPHGGVEIAEALRDRGYGVTELSGHGREGTVEIVDCVVHRSHLSDVMAIVDRWDTGAFVTVSGPARASRRLVRDAGMADRGAAPGAVILPTCGTAPAVCISSCALVNCAPWAILSWMDLGASDTPDSVIR